MSLDLDTHAVLSWLTDDSTLSETIGISSIAEPVACDDLPLHPADARSHHAELVALRVGHHDMVRPAVQRVLADRGGYRRNEAFDSFRHLCPSDVPPLTPAAVVILGVALGLALHGTAGAVTAVTGVLFLPILLGPFLSQARWAVGLAPLTAAQRVLQPRGVALDDGPGAWATVAILGTSGRPSPERLAAAPP